MLSLLHPAKLLKLAFSLDRPFFLSLLYQEFASCIGVKNVLSFSRLAAKDLFEEDFCRWPTTILQILREERGNSRLKSPVADYFDAF